MALTQRSLGAQQRHYGQPCHHCGQRLAPGQTRSSNLLILAKEAELQATVRAGRNAVKAKVALRLAPRYATDRIVAALASD
jgi:hypothetical protein